MNSSPTSKIVLALFLAATAAACTADTDAPSEVAAQGEGDDDVPVTTTASQSETGDDSTVLAPDLSGAGTSTPANAGESLPTDAPATPTAPPTTGLDADGVKMLLPSAAGTNFRLGGNDPNDTGGFLIENRVPATPQTLGSLRYWNTAAFGLNYSAGGTGKTSRLHIVGGAQNYTWKTQNGFLSTAGDLKNQEVTAYVRVHDIFDPVKGMVTLKIRGGQHMANNGDLASCTMMTLGADAKTMFGKELTHPNYAYVKLAPRFDASLKDGQWVGMKIVSYSMPADPTKVVNQLYLDTDPFDASGAPVNGWRLLSEYVDVEGKSTGSYSKLANWGAERTTVRTDGVSSVDFALVSAREITPPN